MPIWEAVLRIKPADTHRALSSEPGTQWQPKLSHPTPPPSSPCSKPFQAGYKCITQPFPAALGMVEGPHCVCILWGRDEKVEDFGEDERVKGGEGKRTVTFCLQSWL